MDLVQSATITLQQLRNLLEIIPSDTYANKLEVFSGSSIGQHCRHVIEFFQCLIQEADHTTVCYDHRQREKKLEDHTNFAIASIDEILLELPKMELNKPLNLACDYHTIPNEIKPNLTETTLARELVYNIEHAIHHMAIIKIGLKAIYPEFKLPDGFGVAPSTVRFRDGANA